jgi:hypothetical protein
MRLALSAVLLAVFMLGYAQSRAPVPPPPKAPGEVLVALPAGTDPHKAMEAAYRAFAGRKWAVSLDADGAALVARNRNFDIDATLKVFVGDGALRYIDGTVDSKGRKAQVPERWLNYIRADLRRPAPRARDQDAGERLQRLKSLLDRGLISPEEYEAKRAEILRGL